MTVLRSARLALLTASAMLAANTHSALAGFAAFYNDHEGWSAAAGDFKTIDFVLGTPQFLSDQYASLGIHFTGGNDVAVPSPGYGDGWGVKPNGQLPPLVEIGFDEPQYAFSIKFPGTTGFTLFSGGTAIWSGAWGGWGPNFLGVISSTGFDEVHLTSPLGQVNVDDIYFSSSIPAPASVLVLTALSLGGRRRRA